MGTSTPTSAPTGSPFGSSHVDPLTTMNSISTSLFIDVNAANNGNDDMDINQMFGFVFGALFVVTLIVLMAYCIHTKKKQKKDFATEVIKIKAKLQNAPDSVQMINLSDCMPAETKGATTAGPGFVNDDFDDSDEAAEGDDMYVTGYVHHDHATSMGGDVEVAEQDDLNLDTEEDDEDIHQMYDNFDEQDTTANGLETVK